MSKNRLYVYTFIFFFMVCIGLIAGSYTVNINKKHWIDAQTEMNPHTNAKLKDGTLTNPNTETSDWAERTKKNKNRVILQMLFDVYVTVNASVDAEYACTNAVAILKQSTDLSDAEKENVIDDLNISLQTSISAYQKKFVSMQQNINATLQAMTRVNIIPDADKEVFTSSLQYLNTQMKTLADISHLIVRNEDAFSAENINRVTKTIATISEKRIAAQEDLQNRIIIQLENLK